MWPSLVNDYVRPQPGERVLDIGCGPGDALEYLPEVDYTGVDLSERYIEAARERWGDRGTFVCADVRDAEFEGKEFDVVMSVGVLHHLDDAAARGLIDLAARRLAAGGRFV